MADNCKFN